MKLYLTTEHTFCEIEHSANERMLQLLREYAEQQGIPVVDDVNNADVAIMIASRLQGKGFEVYHQVVPDWAVYTASYKLAAEMQTQVQRYQNLYVRKPKAGYTKPWLQTMPIPAVVCEQYLNGTLDENRLRAQAKAYCAGIRNV